MRTVDSSVAAHSWHQRLGRNLRLLARIAGMLMQYFTEGRRIRALYGECEARGEVYWIDEDPSSRHRDHQIMDRR